MTWPGIEPRSPGPLANTLPTIFLSVWLEKSQIIVTSLASLIDSGWCFFFFFTFFFQISVFHSINIFSNEYKDLNYFAFIDVRIRHPSTKWPIDLALVHTIYLWGLIHSLCLPDSFLLVDFSSVLGLLISRTMS